MIIFAHHMNVEALFRQYYPRLRNYASRFVGNAFVADDIVQECFVKLYERRFRVKDVSPAALLFVMVRNSCLNYVKRKALVETGNPFLVAADLTPEDDLMYEELRLEINRVMATLPPKCREVFQMSRFEGLKVREIADRTNTSTQNVEKHIARALEVFSRHFAGLDISAGGLV